ncbi:MAG: HAD family hydrolase [Dysgonomonas sp.]
MINISNYTTYLFDFDYTLADSSRGIVECFHIVLDRNKWLNISDEAIKRTIGMTLEDSFSQLTEVNDPNRLSALKQEYILEADIIMSDRTVFYPEALPLIEKLKENNKQVGIISTKQSRIIRESTDKYNVTDLFDIIIGMEDVKMTKPDPEGILLAIQKLSAQPQQTIYFGDNIIDAKTALSVNVDFIGTTTGMTTKEELSQYPHKHIVSSLSEITV